MTLPVSGPIDLAQIANEFGLATTSAFPSAFYGKGGAPTTGGLSFGDFYGRSNVPAITASSAPSIIQASGRNSTLTTGNASCTASGGSGGYTYQWILVDGDGGGAANSPNSANTTFTSNNVAPGETQSQTWQCAVTDSGGRMGVSNSISVSFTNTLG